MITAEEKYNRYWYYYAYYRCTKKKRHTPCKQRYINARDLETQIADYLSRINIPEKALALALEYLKDEEQEENEKGLDLKRSQERALSKCQKKLINLNRMRLNDLINDEEYLGEKRRLLDEKIKLETVAAEEDDPNRRANELTEKTFTFASRAVNRFKNGSPEAKRAILQELGSNLFLKDKKLSIEPEKPLTILENGIPRVRSEMEALELPRNGLFERKNDLSLSQIPSLSRLVEDVRTFFLQKIIDDIFRPRD
jgi:hypothetical protein